MTTQEFKIELVKEEVNIIDEVDRTRKLYFNELMKVNLVTSKLIKKATELFEAEKLSIKDSPLNYDSKEEAKVNVPINQIKRNVKQLKEILGVHKKSNIDLRLIKINSLIEELEIYANHINETK